MNTVRACRVACLLALLWAAAAQAQNAPARPEASAARTAERKRIHLEQAAIATRLKQAETACYQRFAVEDCLRAERRQARAERAVLRQRESLLDDTERRERAALRLQDIEQRRDAAQQPLPRVAASRPAKGQNPQVPEQRARRQSERTDVAQAGQAKRQQERQQQAARDRQRQQDKLRAASDRKARVQQEQEQEKARGHQPAAPLPQ